jgi:hypothetical protein
MAEARRHKFNTTLKALVRNLLTVFLLTACAAAKAATISADSFQATDVQKALNLARAGDTVLIPAGSANWTQGVSWTAPANVTLKGASTSATGGGDQTVIIDNYASGQPLLNLTANSNGVFCMTGITVKSGSGSIKDGGTIHINGPGNVRIDHCHFVASSTANYKIILFGSGVFGVMDHCILDLTGTNALYFYNGRGDQQGNYEWTQPTNFGSADYFFVEDNIINGNVPSGAYSTRVFDGNNAAKVVIRFNTLFQTCVGETHATGHAGDDRGLRSQEAYGNSVTSSLAHDPNFVALDMGSGTTLIWGNSWDQVYKNIYHFNVTRKNNDTYNQAPTPNGWGYAGTEFNGTGSNWDGGTALGTDTVKGYPCLDQPGRGQGDLITGWFPSKVNSTTGTIYWPHQALEPIYMWNNIGSIVAGWGGSLYSNNTGGRVVANRDYYPSASGVQTSPTSPFDGTSGTGWGTLANRPTTCTPGVAYFATDQGSWNTSTSNPYGVQQNGASGVLYKCTAPNTWTLYYTPYVYPHPLVTGGNPSPTPTAAPSPIPTATFTPTPTATATATPTATFTPTPTATATVPPSATPIPSPTSTPTPTPVPGGTNVALAANGGVVSASSTYNNNFPVTAVNDGDRLGLNWGNGGGWNDGTPNVWPDWVEIDFNASYPINEIDVFTLQDNYQNPSPPTLDMTFTLYGVTDFEVQYWTGSTWTDIPGGDVTGNNHVWRQFTFANITTAKIRVLINNSLATYSRVTEIEAYKVGENPTPTPTLTATATPTPTPPTPTPTPLNQCEVPNFIGTKLNHAQALWNDAGFTTEVIILPGPDNGIGHYITWQSLPEGFMGSCSDTTIIVE